jgi:general secretion pathway protein E
MDIAEKRRPQDGRIQLILDKVPSDVRISTIPVAFGEKIVLRLLSSETTLKKTTELGMDKTQFQLFNNFLKNTYGLILVTGPTGSGKSTTLYSTMKTMANPKVNIVTVEEPIEMVVDEFNQIGVQTKIGVTFSTILRNILRQDPDIIMIGEIRDLETAQQAIQAALTGHIVFSTLHTNDASSALTRLIDLGLEPYLINASLIGIIAQRLVRVICPFCKTLWQIRKEDFKSLGVQAYFTDESKPIALYKGAGCEACRKTGFLDRTGIFEIMHYNKELKQALKSGKDVNTIRSLLRKNNIPSLLESGLNQVKKGTTTIDEVLRVTGGIESQ